MDQYHHQIDLYIDPKYSETLSNPLLSHLLQELKTNQKYSVNIFASINTIDDVLSDELLNFNFEIFEKMNVMAKKVRKEG